MPTADKFGGIAGGGSSGAVTSPASAIARGIMKDTHDLLPEIPERYGPLRPLTGTASIGGSFARGIRYGGSFLMILDALSLLNAVEHAPVCTPIL